MKNKTKKTCGNCVCYLTDTDKNENLSDFHHDRNKAEGFCAVRDLFYEVKKDTEACSDYVDDGGKN